MRARTASRGTLSALAALALSACQEPDVGQPCDLDVYAGSPPASIDFYLEPGVACSADDADYFRSGVPDCDNLICIRSATGAACGNDGVAPAYPLDVRKYCSKPCVSDGDCDNDRIHLVCRPIVLDSGYLVFLQQCAAAQAAGDPLPPGCPPDPAATLALLGTVPSSNYCATPPRP
jgi:hypothetical protein